MNKQRIIGFLWLSLLGLGCPGSQTQINSTRSQNTHIGSENQEESDETLVNNYVDWAKLRDENPKVRQIACQRLREEPKGVFFRRATPEVSAALVEMLKDPNEEVRSEARISLVNIIEPNKTAPLIKALESGDAFHRYQAAFALGTISSESFGAAKQLTAALADPDELVRARPAWALARIRIEEAEVLHTIGIGLESKNEVVVWFSMNGLAEAAWRSKAFFEKARPASVVGSLLRILAQNECYQRRSEAASLLADCNDTSDQVIAGLTSALGDNEKKVRKSAAFAFSYLAIQDYPSQVFQILSDSMDSAESWSSRREVCKALDRMNQFPPCVISTLKKHIDDKDEENRLRIACLLSRTSISSFEEVEDVLVSSMNQTPEPYLEVQILEALARIGPKTTEGLETIRRAKTDRAEEVREAAERIVKGPPHLANMVEGIDSRTSMRVAFRASHKRRHVRPRAPARWRPCM